MSSSTVGIHAVFTEIKSVSKLIHSKASEDITVPKIMLLGRIVKVFKNNKAVGHFNISSDRSLGGLTLVGKDTIRLEEGTTVEVGTGYSPVGYTAERKILISGPGTFSNLDEVSTYREANKPIRGISHLLV